MRNYTFFAQGAYGSRIHVHLAYEKAIEFVVNEEAWNRTRPFNTGWGADETNGATEYLLLCDGAVFLASKNMDLSEAGDYPPIEPNNHFLSSLEPRIEAKIEEMRIKEEQFKQEQERERQEAIEKRERAEYLRLSAKYFGPSQTKS